MDYVPFGSTGLKVSVAGLGCGGSSRLGQSQGRSREHSIALVRQAFESGVTLFDTAQAYGTESIVGAALKAVPRDQVVISSKFKAARGTDVLSEVDVVKCVDHSLSELQTDYVDVFNLHAVVPSEYDLVIEQVVPVLQREKEKGKIRHIGITEAGPLDHPHEMLQQAVREDAIEVMSVAYNMMNQNAGHDVLPTASERGVASMIMFAVRAVFSIPGRLQKDVSERVRSGELPQWLADKDNPLDFLLHDYGAENIIDAAYRYVRHKPFTDVVLFGTGNPAHMESNIQSILRPPLPEADVLSLETLFSHLTGFGADYPEPPSKS